MVLSTINIHVMIHLLGEPSFVTLEFSVCFAAVPFLQDAISLGSIWEVLIPDSAAAQKILCITTFLLLIFLISNLLLSIAIGFLFLITPTTEFLIRLNRYLGTGGCNQGLVNDRQVLYHLSSLVLFLVFEVGSC
jgi:hypothetical protein